MKRLDNSPDERGLWRDSAFRSYFGARVLAAIGGAVSYIAMPVLVYELTGSGFWTGVVAAMQGVPHLFFGLLAGALADRVDRKRLMVGADVAAALLIGSIPVAYWFEMLTLTHVVAVAFASQSLMVFFMAANFGAVPALVGRARIGPAQAALMGASTTVELTVPIAAGALMVLFAPGSMLGVQALTFVASALLVGSILRPFSTTEPQPGRRLTAEIVEGIRFVWNQLTIRLQTLVAAAQLLAGGVFLGQVVPWARESLGLPEADARLGMILASWGAGSLLASLVFTRLVAFIGERRVTTLMLPITVVGPVGCALANHWVAGMVAVLVWGTANTVVVLNSLTVRQKVTPDRLQGRVGTAARMLSIGVAWPVGAAGGGVVAAWVSPAGALWVAGGVLVVVALVVAEAQRRGVAIAAPASEAEPSSTSS